MNFLYKHLCLQSLFIGKKIVVIVYVFIFIFNCYKKYCRYVVSSLMNIGRFNWVSWKIITVPLYHVQLFLKNSTTNFNSNLMVRSIETILILFYFSYLIYDIRVENNLSRSYKPLIFISRKYVIHNHTWSTLVKKEGWS